ncbi:MAG: hypothetical protein D6687_03270 [Acidobacteria bacterium]|jgi:hypothetical protein|nr:MAG: hypothetical protein D6687_03270 [Acidobacteriota bacterium]
MEATVGNTVVIARINNGSTYISDHSQMPCNEQFVGDPVGEDEILIPATLFYGAENRFTILLCLR